MIQNRFLKDIYGKRLYPQAILMIALSFAVATAQFLATRHLGEVIDAVEKGYEQTMHHVSVIAFSLLFYIIGSGVFTFFNGRIAAGFSRCIQMRIGMKICSARYQAIERMDDGELLTMLTRDAESIRNWLVLLLKSGFLPASLGLAPVSLFRWCNWKFSLLVLGLIPLNALGSVLLSRRLPAFYQNEKKAYAGVLSLFTATIQFVMLIKAFQLEQIFQNKTKEELYKYRKARKKRILYEQLAEEFNRSFGHVSSILILLLSAYFIFTGEMTVGRLTSVILLANFVGEGLKILGSIPVCLSEAKTGIIRIQGLLGLQDEPVKENSIQTVEQPGEVSAHKTSVHEVSDCKVSVYEMPVQQMFGYKVPVFEVHRLGFSYGDTVVLQDISFRVKRGEKIAVVGASGCGKTTLFKLLSGLYIPEENQIYFMGMDAAKLSPEYLRHHITATTQEAFLFHATWKENIRVAKPEGSEPELIAACKNAQIDSYIQALPHRYDTEVITTVQSVSNGQMQRINLARAFCRNTDIFLLDEPVSALDAGTAGLVWDYLFTGCADKTLLVILHDLEEIFRFHKILVLAQGKQAGFGTHEELIRNCGVYRKLYEEKMVNRSKGEA